MKVQLYNKKGQLTGLVVDGRLVKQGLDPAKHQLRYPPAWAIDSDHIDKLVELSAWGVELTTVSGEVWLAPVSEFLLNGVKISRGEGEQIALPLAYWKVIDERQLFLL